MRITIHTDDQGKVNIDTDKPSEKAGLFESTPDVPVTDAGAAPSEHIQQWNMLTNAATSAEASIVPTARNPDAELPLNPLRAGAAAAYASAANRAKAVPASQEMTAATYAATTAADDTTATVDGGAAAHIPRASAPSEAAPAPKQAKRRKKR